MIYEVAIVADAIFECQRRLTDVVPPRASYQRWFDAARNRPEGPEASPAGHDGGSDNLIIYNV